MNFDKLKSQVVSFAKTVEEKYNQDALKNMQYQMAIGESGKGSVFGSIFITAVWWPKVLKPQLQKFRLDEKTVNQYQKSCQRELRKQIFSIINVLKQKAIFYESIQLTATKISQNMNNLIWNCNLNQLIYNAVDTVSRKPFQKNFIVTHILSKSFGSEQKEQARMKHNLEEYKQIIKKITIQSKADAQYSLVSTANLIARALNQQNMEQWKFNEQMYFEGKFGSGGTNDPVTKKWLEQNKHHVFGYPNIVRFSWKTTQNCLKNKLIMTLDEGKEKREILKKVSFGTLNRQDRQRDLWEIIPKKDK